MMRLKSNGYARLQAGLGAIKNPSYQVQFIQGMKDIVPSIAGICAWSIVTGIAMSKSLLSLGQLFGMSWIIYAGSSQIAVLPLLAAGVPIWTILLTVFFVNLRFVVFSAILQPHFKSLPLWRRGLLSYLSVDISFFLFTKRFPDANDTSLSTSKKEAYFYGLAFINMLTWQAATLVGVILGHSIPNSWGLSLAGVLVLLALLLPPIATRPGLLATIAAAIIAVTTYSLPYKLNLILAVLGAVIVGLFTEEMMEKRKIHECA